MQRTSLCSPTLKPEIYRNSQNCDRLPSANWTNKSPWELSTGLYGLSVTNLGSKRSISRSVRDGYKRWNSHPITNFWWLEATMGGWTCMTWGATLGGSVKWRSTLLSYILLISAWTPASSTPLVAPTNCSFSTSWPGNRSPGARVRYGTKVGQPGR